MPADTVSPVPTAEDGRAFSRPTDHILITAYLNPQEVDMSGFLEFASPVGEPSTMRTGTISPTSSGLPPTSKASQIIYEKGTTMHEALVIIPTYNEKDSLKSIIGE